ncbi:MAG: hypothetical protein ACREM2_09545 [Vulcanimicrobiaceae bacterium]
MSATSQPASIPDAASSPARPLPSGTVTFAFTDIEGSTVRWERDREGMQAALPRHDALLRETIAEHSGHVFKTIGARFAACSRGPKMRSPR